VKIGVVVQSARAEAAVRPLEIGEGRGGSASIATPDEAPVHLIDTVVPDEQVHVDTGAEVRPGIDGVRERGTFQEQDLRISESAQEATEFGMTELLDQFRRTESPGGLLADSHRETLGAPEEGGEQEVDRVGGRALPKPGKFLVRQGPRQRPLGKRCTQQRIERQSGASRAHTPIVRS
jgi:hypothetical protein